MADSQALGQIRCVEAGGIVVGRDLVGERCSYSGISCKCTGDAGSPLTNRYNQRSSCSVARLAIAYRYTNVSYSRRRRCSGNNVSIVAGPS